jgi:hypothetical protein
MFSRKEKTRDKKSGSKTGSDLDEDNLMSDSHASSQSALRVCPLCHKPADGADQVCASCGTKLTGGSAWR